MPGAQLGLGLPAISVVSSCCFHKIPVSAVIVPSVPALGARVLLAQPAGTRVVTARTAVPRLRVPVSARGLCCVRNCCLEAPGVGNGCFYRLQCIYIYIYI